MEVESWSGLEVTQLLVLSDVSVTRVPPLLFP